MMCSSRVENVYGMECNGKGKGSSKTLYNIDSLLVCRTCLLTKRVRSTRSGRTIRIAFAGDVVGSLSWCSSRLVIVVSLPE
jgi:hypothetical protein